MIRSNFRTVAMVLALHVPRELAAELNNAANQSLAHPGEFDSLMNLAESGVINLMHEAFKDCTESDTPLFHMPTFVGCLSTFIENEGFSHLGEYLNQIHTDTDTVISELNTKGITIDYNDDGATINTKSNSKLSIVKADKVLH